MATLFMERYPIGQLLLVKALPSWLTLRVGYGYCDDICGMECRVIGYTLDKDKLAVEFKDPIWTRKQNGKWSGFDNGCHGKGKLHHCVYLLPGHVSKIEQSSIQSDNSNNLLLLY